MREIRITIRPDEIDGGFISECPDVPGCLSQGESEEDALLNLTEALALCIEVRRDSGMPVFVPQHPL